MRLVEAGGRQVRWQLKPEMLEPLSAALLARSNAPPLSLRLGGSLLPALGSAAETELLHRVAPHLELLFLMMLADGHAQDSERKLLWGAARSLSGDRLSRVAFDRVLQAFDDARHAEGLESRLATVAGGLAADRASAEGAFALAAAMAVVDRDVESRESDLLGEISELLGISDRRAAELMGVDLQSKTS